MLNLARTAALVKGALFDAKSTWNAYLPEADDWKQTAILLTGPLIVLAGILGYVIGLLGSGASMFGFRPTLMSTLVGMIMSAIAAGVVAFIVSTLAGMFGGKNNFAHGLAATTFAFVPGYLGQALNWLPWIGTLLALGLFIYALVLLWRIIPIYLDVPAAKRTGHYVASLITTIVTMFLISMLMRPLMGPGMVGAPDFSGSMSDGRPSGIGGLAGEAMRQGELMAAAEEDRYEPPGNGQLDRSQVEEFIRVNQRAEALVAEKSARIRERAENDEELSLNEMSELMSGASTIMGFNTVELEIVKSSGGNWAEYEWVKNALRTAYVQQDINNAVAYNFALYQEFENELQPFVTR